ncbi:MAG: histidine kinase dimerization/phospho-acceptor domain-containing protein [Terriglobales bacterium]
MRSESECAAPQSVLLITDDVVFRSHAMKLWQAEATPPLVMWVPSDLVPDGENAWCDAAVLGPVAPENLASALQTAAAAPAAVAVLPWGVSLAQIQLANPTVIPMHESEEAFEIAVLIGKALLRHVAMERELGSSKSAARQNCRNAALGQFMLDNRHSFNNALTAVLGTSELLLLLDSSELNGGQREQVRTIHTMAKRLHQLIVGFSALESEMKLAELVAIAAGEHDFEWAGSGSEVRQ